MRINEGNKGKRNMNGNVEKFTYYGEMNKKIGKNEQNSKLIFYMK